MINFVKMNPLYLIPSSEPIPASAEIFIFLEQLFFLMHILIINSILGLSLIILYQSNKKQDFFKAHKPLAKKIPILFAIGINMAIPALLFLQVVFGHLFYTSSILMGTIWILIIPLLIIAYYSSYFHYRNFENSKFAKPVLILIILIIFYIAFMLVNNLSMMELPHKWTDYFTNKQGTILLWSLPSIYPRFFHFLVASVAVGGMFYSIYYSRRSDSISQVNEGLKIFAYATMIQIIVGFWFLLSLPQNIMQKYMGGDLFATVVFVLGVITAIISIFVALMGKLKGSILFLLLTLIFMVINRYHLRTFHLEGVFSPYQLEVVPQWDLFILFAGVLCVGIGVIAYMLKMAFTQKKGIEK